jgi:hypothetical protein
MKTTIYLATARGLRVIAGSDGNWRGAVRLEDKQIQRVAADFNRNGAVYCGTFGDGIFRSDNGGAAWKACSGFTNPKVTALSTSGASVVYAGTEPSMIFRSGDGGETWRELQTLLTLPSAKTWSFPPRPQTHHVQTVLPDLANPNRLHVAIEAGALLRSDDAGGSWRDRVSSGPKDTHSLAVNPHDPTRLHSAARDGYFQSVDDGDSWRRIVEGLEHQYCWSIAVGIANRATLLLSASKSAYAAHFKESASSVVYRRTGDEAWRQVRDGLPEPRGTGIPMVAASRVEPGVFYLSAEREVYRSTDDGFEWQQLEIQWNGRPPAKQAVAMALV